MKTLLQLTVFLFPLSQLIAESLITEKEHFSGFTNAKRRAEVSRPYLKKARIQRDMDQVHYKYAQNHFGVQDPQVNDVELVEAKESKEKTIFNWKPFNSFETNERKTSYTESFKSQTKDTWTSVKTFFSGSLNSKEECDSKKKADCSVSKAECDDKAKKECSKSGWNGFKNFFSGKKKKDCKTKCKEAGIDCNTKCDDKKQDCSNKKECSSGKKANKRTSIKKSMDDFFSKLKLSK